MGGPGRGLFAAPGSSSRSPSKTGGRIVGRNENAPRLRVVYGPTSLDPAIKANRYRTGWELP